MMNGYKRGTEAQEYSYIGRGAFPVRGRVRASVPGALGKANVGISNDNAGAKPAHRKTKVS